jgi:hypothetical protein
MDDFSRPGLLSSQSLVAISVGDRTMVQPSPSLLLLSSLSSSPHSLLFLLDSRCFVGASLLPLSASVSMFVVSVFFSRKCTLFFLHSLLVHVFSSCFAAGAVNSGRVI